MARAIDADDLMVYLHCRMGQIPCDEYGLYLLADVAEYVAKMPTIEAEPVKHGEWRGWGKGGTYHYENYGTCSVCHEDAEIGTKYRNYCPNCGARMDGE